MKLKKNIDFSDLLDALQYCRKDVYLDTAEGDHLNLILFLERKSIKKNFVFARKGSNSKALRPVTKRSFSFE